MSGTPILVRWLSQVPVSGKPGKREIFTGKAA